MKKIILVLSVVFGLAGSVMSQIPYMWVYDIFEYCPAPGQFVNDIPLYEPGDTQEDIIMKVKRAIEFEEKGLVSLGAYGGYIVFSFFHPVENVPGEYDFEIWANAVAPETLGSSSEPGIVLVSYDANANGLPDDEWYELAGSEYGSPSTIRDYEITYYKPESSDSDIRWTDNQGGEGFVRRNTFHDQPYWPQWIEEETLTFRGSRLADNYVKEGANYIFHPYDWGYVDNHPNDTDGNKFNIEWAVDEYGNKVSLPEINFVKVYTAVNQDCGWLGESSTEIAGAINLHFKGYNSLESVKKQGLTLLTNPVCDQLIFTSDRQQAVSVYDLQGRCLVNIDAQIGTNKIDCSGLLQNIYILSTPEQRIKFIKQ